MISNEQGDGTTTAGPVPLVRDPSRKGAKMKQATELYLHIPFCVKKCEYCDFLSGPADAARQDAYAKALLREIENTVLPDDTEISSIFIGGGTPSVIPEEWIQHFLDKIRDRFCLAADAEITIEANPGTLNRERLSAYRRGGVNRLSIGLQSAVDSELKRLGRIHTFRDFQENFEEARNAGFSNINVDLMMALPGQNRASWRKSLETVAAFSPEHISAYSLIVEPGTPFAGQELDLPGEEEERQMYWETVDFLKFRGYEQYEISNFAKAGYECRHNIGYWMRTPYLGLGLGASSLIEENRFSNTENMGEYLTVSGEPDSIRKNRETLTAEEQMEEFMFLGLRMTKGVSENRFLQLYGADMDEIYGAVIARFVELGLMERANGRVRLSREGVSVSNAVMSEFLLSF